MRNTFMIYLLLLFVICSCGDEHITNNHIGFNRTFVIITDFDRSSELVLSIEGIVRKEFPNVEFVYIQSRNFDVAQASFVLEQAKRNYPINAIFLAVVEPGANQKKIVFNVGEQTFLVPNNGIASRIFANYNHSEIRYVDNMLMFDGKYNSIDEVSYSEIYLKASRNILSGAPLRHFGSPCNTPENIPVFDAYINGNSIVGQSLYVDNIGNVETNIPISLLNSFEIGSIIKIESSSGKFYAKWTNSFAGVPPGANLALLNHEKRLLLAESFGNLSEKYNVHAGDTIKITLAQIKIGLLRFNSSELVNNIIENTKKQLSNLGFINNTNVTYIELNAEGVTERLPDLVFQLLQSKCDIIIPISTPASKAAVEYVPNSIPLVFTYVTSPEFAGILNKRSKVTGISDATNFDDYLGFVKELFPELTLAARLYNPNEPNSEFAQQRLKSLSRFYELNYYNNEITDVNAIEPAVDVIHNQGINTILVAADNTLNLGMSSLATKAKGFGIRVIGDSRENVEDGALAGVSVDYTRLANETANSVSAVLLGVNADKIPVKYLPTTQVFLNIKTAQSIGFIFSDEIISKASYIVE